jgi:hypothetical protein
LEQELIGKEGKIIRRRIFVFLAFLTAGAILSIYIYDAFFCIYEESYISFLALIVALVILIGTIGGVFMLKKENPTEMTSQI